MSISSTVTTTIPGVLAVGVFGNSPVPTPTPTPNPTPTPTPEPTPNPTPTPTPNPTPTAPTYDNDYGYAEVDYGWDNKDGAALNIAAVPFDNEHYWYEGSPAVPNYGRGETGYPSGELKFSGVSNGKKVSRLMAQDNDNLYFMTIAQKYAKVGNVYKGHFLIRTIVSKANPSQAQTQYFNLQTLLPVSFNLFGTNVELIGLVASKLFVVEPFNAK